MRSTLVVSFIIAAAAAVLVVGGLLIWYQDGSPPSSPPVDPGGAQTSTPPTRPVTPPQPVRVPPAATNLSSAPTTRVEPPAAPQLSSESETPGAVDWDERVSELMTSGLDDLQTSLKILEMMKKLPETNQVQAAEFLTGLMPDEGYPAVVPLLTNAHTSEEVMDVLMIDLLDRPNAIQLPLLLDLARNPAHPRREEAREYLELYVDADHGSNWGAWEAAIKKFLAENPE